MGKRILGLDLGTNSIGWAVVDDLGNGQFDLVKRGAHIFSEAVNTAPQGGARKSKAADRREKRSARKLNYRRKIRKINTLNVLIEHGMCPGITGEDLDTWRYDRKYPENDQFRKWQSTNDLSENNIDKEKRNPYLFRFKAIEQKFNWNNEGDRQKLGRVFYHLAQRRGFKSNRLDGGSDDVYDSFHEGLQKEFEQKHDSIAEIIILINELTSGEQDKKISGLKRRLFKILKTHSDLDAAIKDCQSLLNKPEFLGKVKLGIYELDLEIKKSKTRTLGEYFYRCYEKGNKIRGHYTDRENHYKKEFDEICRVQEFDEDLKQKLYDAIFYQRPLRSQKGLVACCSLEFRLPVFKNGSPDYRNEKLVTYSKRCASISHPIFEEFRMWSFINQIKWKKDKETEVQFLSKSQKEKITSLFYRKSKPYFKFSEITKKLFGKNSTVARIRDEEKIQAAYYVNYALDTSVSGCPVVSEFRTVFGEDYQHIIDASYIGKRENKTNNKKSMNDILTEAWGVLFSRENPVERKRQLMKNWTVSIETADAFSTIKLPQGYASLSLAAMRKIIPLLKGGMIYSHAVLFANLPAVLRDSSSDVDDVKNLLSEKLDSYFDYRRAAVVANELNAGFDSFDLLMNEMKRPAEFEEIIGNIFIKKFGSSDWNKMPKNKKYNFSLQVIELLKIQYANQEEAGKWIKLIPLKTILNDVLINECGVSTERAMLLYHPSDIRQHNPYRKSETGLLGSPIVSSIKNPVFMRTMHRLKAVVNALIKDETIYPETEIHVEMARDLNTANMRAVIESDHKTRQERRNKYAEIIKNLMGINASENDLLKFKLWEELSPEDSEKDWITLNEKIEAKSLKYELWEEQKRICPYTGKTIGLADFLSDNPRFEIEHILPRSRSYDNSAENLTLCCKIYNREIKKSKIPSECINFGEIRPRIKHWKKRADELEVAIKKTIYAARNADPERKAKIIQKRHRLKLERNHYMKKYEHFTMEEVPDSFANRQLNDTRVITKYACLYLKTVFRNVTTVNGLTVAELRKQWGLQHSEKKSREKHTHHCIDAIVIACMTKWQYDQLSAFYKREEFEKFNAGNVAKPIKQPWDFFIPSIKQLEGEVLIAHYAPNHLLKNSGVLPPRIMKQVKMGAIKYKKNEETEKKIETVRGRLHNDTFYGRILHNGEEVSVVRVPLIYSKEKLKGFENLDDIKTRVVAQNIWIRIEEVVRGRLDSGMSFSESLKNIYQNDDKKILIKRVRCKVNDAKEPLKIKLQRDQSKIHDHPHKRHFYAKNSTVPAVAIYERNGSLIHVGYDALTAVDKKLKFEETKIDKQGRALEIKYILHPKQKVIFYEFELDELKLLYVKKDSKSDKELSDRLFHINDLSKKETRLILRHHLVAGKKKDLESDNKRLRGTKFPSSVNFDSPNPLQRISYKKLNIAVEDKHFRLSVLGEVEWLD